MGGAARVKQEPQRTCIGCRQVRPKARLIRLVRKSDGVVDIDRTGAGPGRGAYVCPAPECVEAALKRGRLTRAFRGKAEASAEVMTLREMRGRWPDEPR